jgi:two-component system chemotaxis sensor kinase CheA
VEKAPAMSNSNSFVQDEFFDGLLSDFLDESAQLLQRLNENLLELDEWVASTGGRSPCDVELLNDMFRSAHSIKGLSAMLGLSSVNSLTHKIENVFDASRKNELTLDGHAVEVVFQSCDLLAAMIEQLKESGSDDMDADHVSAMIQSLLERAGCARWPSSQHEADAALAAVGSPPPSAHETAQESREHELPAPASTQNVPVETNAVTSRIDYFADIADEGEVPGKYLSIFIDETVEALDSLAETLISGESDGGASTETLLITSHRIKGSAASVGLNRPAKLAHLMEDILHELREAGDPLSGELTDAMLGCTDALRQYVAGLRQGSPQSESFNEHAHALLEAKAKAVALDAPKPSPNGGETTPATACGQEAMASTSEAPVADASSEPATESITADALSDIWGLARKQAQHQGPALLGRVVFQPQLPLVGLKARLVYEKLQHLDDVFWCDPPSDQLEELDQLSVLRFALAGEYDLSSVRSRLSVAGVDCVELSPVSSFEDFSVSVCGSASPVEVIAGSHAEYSQETSAGSAASAAVASHGDAAAKAASNAHSAGSQPNADGKTPARITDAEAAPRSPEASARRGRNSDAGGAGKPTETLRVDIERLDQLMNLAGQLVINKARFTQIGDGLRGAMPSKQTPQLIENAVGSAARLMAETERTTAGGDAEFDLEHLRCQVRRLHADLEIAQREISRLSQIRGRVNDLFEAVHQLDRVSDGIQQSVMDTRMVPIGPLFGRFKRVVRDITRGNGKEIRLTIRGEKTELDKRMIDELGDPLIHMVRNSADHGVETPERRSAKGKPRQGEITLDAFHRGNSIYIQVKDDGKGLDGDRILAKALQKRIVTPAEAEKLTPHQVHQLIWEPGFSTAETVTEISGRGMGMDIVRSKIEELNGAVEVDSELGAGATFTIKLPLTLAILPSLMAEIDGDVFALPIESVVEIVSISTRELSTVHGLSTATIRGRIVSVVDLNNVFTWHPEETRPPNHVEPSESTVVVIGQEGKELGLLVHSLLGEEDVVIKSLAENYHNVPGIAGASILGDGRVSLILDVSALIEMSSNAAVAANA